MCPPKLLLNNNFSGKPEDIYLFPRTASEGGVRQLDDVEREYAYGPANGLPDTKVGTFTPALYDGAKSKGWPVISVKIDWKRIFAFER